MIVRRDGNLSEAGGVEILTPAKVNLFLEVVARRSDGYHDLDTLFAAVDLYDHLTLVPRRDGRITLRAAWASGWREQGLRQGIESWGDLPQAEENLVVRAIRKLQEAAGVSLGAELTLVKRIPSAAGLGGASSDAAAALVAASIAWDLRWSRDRLAPLAAQIGADVPFFLVGGAARGLGRGEELTPLPDCPPLHLVLVRPAEGLSTPAVFRRCRVPESPRSPESLVAAWQRGDAVGVAERLHNRLSEAARELSPAIARLEGEFWRQQVLGTQMSGSGSTCFAVTRGPREARRLAALLRARGCGFVAAVRTIGRGLHVERCAS